MSLLFMSALLLLQISIGVGEEDIVKSVQVNTDGQTSLDETRSVPTNANDLLFAKIETKFESLQTQISELETHINKQEMIINELNETLNTFVFTSMEMGIVYDKSDDRPLLLTSEHSHSAPFVMLNVMSVRLPKRDSYNKKRKRSKKKGPKRRYIHIIITLNNAGIFSLWDDEQNELYNTSMDTPMDTMDSTVAVYSDIITQNKYGNTWFVMGRSDSQFVSVYSVSAWRDYANDRINDRIRKSVIEGQMTAENVIQRPNNTNNATVTGITVYQQQRKQYIIAAYSDGLVFAFKLDGRLASRKGPFQSPNKSIVALSRSRKKYEIVIVTEFGFQFVKLPKLKAVGPFCSFGSEHNTIVSDISFDSISTTVMYLGTADGRVLVYNTKKLNRKMCNQALDAGMRIHPSSPLKMETIPGYLLITSDIGLHVYNVSKTKTAQYIRPAPIFVDKFEENGKNHLISSYTDAHQRTVIAYIQAQKFVVLESYLPSFESGTDRGGILSIVSKAPIFVGMALFAFFWVFFKGKGKSGGGFGNSPIGRLGKIFGGGGGRRNNRRSLSRGGPTDVRGKKDRWNARHNNNATAKRTQSANIRYGNKNRASLGSNEWSD